MKLRTQPHLHLWFPGLFKFKGGIQVYTAFTLNALQQTYSKAHYDVFLKNDADFPTDHQFLERTRFHCTGEISSNLRTLIYALKLFRFGLQEKPNLIMVGHIHFTPPANWLKKIRGIPYWVFAYGIEAWDIQSPNLKKALHCADRILAISNYTRNRLIQDQNIDPARIFLLPCTLDPSGFQIKPKPIYLLTRHHLNPDQPTILTVARLSEVERYKGYDQILKALPKIRQVIPNVHYVLVGKGGDRPRIENLITQLQLQDCVTLAGFIPDEELCDYYNLCDVFAMPSKREGFGIVYLEALACGKPTLGGNQDGAVDALCNGTLGALVNPDNIEEIAQTLIQILQGNYPNALMYQPEQLRQKVIDTYGFERFKQTLAGYLAESGLF